MRCPRLHELPPPPAGKSGWPWTTETPPASTADDSEWPRLSIVTISYNQAAYLEETIRSVLLQGYPNLEYIVIDGGSEDASVDVIHKYERWISYWVSEPDGGSTFAINKGLRRAAGEWVGLQNSDDFYYPGCFCSFAQTLRRSSDVGLVTGDVMLIDRDSMPIRDLRFTTPTYRELLALGMNLAQQAAFWRTGIHNKIGYWDETLDCAVDYEWFVRLTKNYKAAHVPEVWGAYRLHEEGKLATRKAVFASETVLILAGRTVGPWERRFYQVRRSIFMLMHGRIGYVARGLARRAREYLHLA
jgi:glycosyltransferase involved in cell wall biosynthesis